MEQIPHKSPVKRGIKMRERGKVVSVSIRKSAVEPKPRKEKKRDISWLVATEMDTMENKRGEKRLWISSMAKSMAVIGEPVARANPDAAPPVII